MNFISFSRPKEAGEIPMTEQINLPANASEEEIRTFVAEVEDRETLEALYGFGELLSEHAQAEINFRESHELGAALAESDGPVNPGSDLNRI